MSKNKKQKIILDYNNDDDFLINIKSLSINTIQNKIEEGEKKEELYQKKIEERDIDLIERLYFENKLKYNEIWIEYLIKQLTDVKNKNYADLFDSDSDDSNQNNFYIEDLEKEDEENMENYERLIGKLKNRFSEESGEYIDLNDFNNIDKNLDNYESESSTDEENYDEEELENEELQEFIMTRNMEEESFNLSIERIKNVMNNKEDENYSIGMYSLYQMLDKIIIQNKNYKKIYEEWNEYYKNYIENKISDNININNKKYDFFREKILKL